MASDVAKTLAEDLYLVRPEWRGNGLGNVVSGPDGETVHKVPIEANVPAV